MSDNGAIEAEIERDRQQTAVSSGAVVPSPVSCPWVVKNPERRLRVFKLMSQGQPVAPDYVPVPGPVGPLFRCEVCGLGPLLQHRVVAQPRKMRSPFPLSDIEPSSGSAHTPSANKPMSRQKHAWKPDITGDENQRPHATRSSVGSDPLPRRSTAPLALGRVTGTRRRPFGCEVARGLFGGGATDRAGASSSFRVVKDRAPLKRAFGAEGSCSRRPEQRCGRSLSSPSISSIASLSTPFPEGTDPSTRHLTPTTPTASPSPSASPATSATWASLSRTLSSSTPPSRPLDRSDGGSAPASEAVYPFGTFADGM